MSRWDDRNYNNYNSEGMIDAEEEARLLKKFQDYKDIEKKEVERRRFLEISNKRKPGIWTKRFIISAMIQGAIIVGLTLSLVITEIIYSDINLMQLLSLSFDGAAKWFFFGYIMYMTLVVAIAVTGVFYNHVEVNMKKEFHGFKNILAWIHIVGMNVGGTTATMLMIWSGLAGAGVTSLVVSGGTIIETEPTIMKHFATYVGIGVILLAAGILSGGIAFLTAYLQKSEPNFADIK